MSNWNFNFTLRQTKATHSIASIAAGSVNLHWQLESNPLIPSHKAGGAPPPPPAAPARLHISCLMDASLLKACAALACRTLCA